jgi:hypothetical protein
VLRGLKSGADWERSSTLRVPTPRCQRTQMWRNRPPRQSDEMARAPVGVGSHVLAAPRGHGMDAAVASNECDTRRNVERRLRCRLSATTPRPATRLLLPMRSDSRSAARVRYRFRLAAEATHTRADANGEILRGASADTRHRSGQNPVGAILGTAGRCCGPTERATTVVPLESIGTMRGDGGNAGKHADVAQRKADLEAIHSYLDFIESKLLVKEVRSKIDRSQSLLDQLEAVREARRSR